MSDTERNLGRAIAYVRNVNMQLLDLATAFRKTGNGEIADRLSALSSDLSQAESVVEREMRQDFRSPRRTGGNAS